MINQDLIRKLEGLGLTNALKFIKPSCPIFCSQNGGQKLTDFLQKVFPAHNVSEVENDKPMLT